MALIVLLVFGSLIGPINDAISVAIPSLDDASATLLALVPLAIVIVILAMVLENRMDQGVY